MVDHLAVAQYMLDQEMIRYDEDDKICPLSIVTPNSVYPLRIFESNRQGETDDFPSTQLEVVLEGIGIVQPSFIRNAFSLPYIVGELIADVYGVEQFHDAEFRNWGLQTEVSTRGEIDNFLRAVNRYSDVVHSQEFQDFRDKEGPRIRQGLGLLLTKE